MSDYTHKPGGSLKFKGEGEKKKKKKPKSSDPQTISASTRTDSRSAERDVRRDSRSASPTRDGRREGHDRRVREGERGERRGREDSEDEGREGRQTAERNHDTAAVGGRQMTESERKFLEVQRQRLIEKRAERVAKGAHLTHKDRVSEFNQKLDKLTEHNDIPKISWTG